MFEITDPARAADIRMRRRRAFWLLVGTGVAIAVISGGNDKAVLAPKFTQGVAAPTLSATGDSLTLALPCAGSIRLVPQPGLNDKVLVDGGDTRGLHLSGGSQMVLQGDCAGGAPDLVVHAPASMMLTIAQSGATDLTLGDFTGAVHLSIHGSGDVVIARAGALDGTMTGSGDLTVARLDGDLHLSHSGSGDIVIRHIQAASVGLTATGTGDVLIRSGRIDQFAAIMRGTGDLAVDAQVKDASVQAGSESDVSLPHVTGRLERSVPAQPR
ncbi:GIN domain-containing protein [Lichenicoccus sp.]|uniref:GIN domain-containing protein n=1 Tax=Lichenicoccus sp. TaxID=2781899 RepID=UPI003D134881